LPIPYPPGSQPVAVPAQFAPQTGGSFVQQGGFSAPAIASTLGMGPRPQSNTGGSRMLPPSSPAQMIRTGSVPEMPANNFGQSPPGNFGQSPPPGAQQQRYNKPLSASLGSKFLISYWDSFFKNLIFF